MSIWKRAAIGVLAAATLASTLPLSPAMADNERKKKEEDKPAETNEALSDPMVQGIVLNAYWAPGKDSNTKTATIVVWSNEADQAVTVYGDNPSVRDAIVNGTACIGRFVVATGDRIDEDVLSAQGIEVPNLSMPCTGKIPAQ